MITVNDAVEFISNLVSKKVYIPVLLVGSKGVGKCIEENQKIICGDGSYVSIKQFVAMKKSKTVSLDESNYRIVNSDVQNWIDSGFKKC